MTRLKPYNYRRVWSETDKRRLSEKWAAGRTLGMIARDLKRTRSGVYSKLWALGLLKGKALSTAPPKTPPPVLPTAYYEGLAAEDRAACPYRTAASDDRVKRGWWLAGFHDGQRECD